MRYAGAQSGGHYYQYLLGKVEGFNAAAKGYVFFVSRENAENQSGVIVGDGMAALGAFGRLPAVGVWAHYAAVLDGSFLRLYVNGTEEEAIDATTKMPSRAGDLFVGRDLREDFSYFAGAVDELAIYDKALPLPTIVQHAALGR